MASPDHFRKRVEYLLGLSIPDRERMDEAVDVQDQIRKRAALLPSGEDSTALIRKWRDTRWSS